MRKNRMMRLASALLILTMVTTCAISGTFAKYVTSDSGTDTARVAKWGFGATDNSIVLDNLFLDSYTNIAGENQANVVAPGETESVDFKFEYDTANVAAKPEVAYTFVVDAEVTGDYADLDKNKNFTWILDTNHYQTVAELIDAIEALDGNVAAADGKPANYYAPNTLPAAFYPSDNGAATHTIGWNWEFEGGTATYDHDGDPSTAELNQDQFDTYMGNETDVDDVTITITITATQVD